MVDCINFVRRLEYSRNDDARYFVGTEIENTIEPLPSEYSGNYLDRQLCIFDSDQNLTERQDCLVLGAGGIGQNVCLTLARVGVRSMTFIDNFIRDLLGSPQNVGQTKFDVAVEGVINFHSISSTMAFGYNFDALISWPNVVSIARHNSVIKNLIDIGAAVAFNLSKSPMKRRLLLLAALASSLPARATDTVSATETIDLNPLLEPLRLSGKLPALAAAVIVDGKLHAVGAVGFRKNGGTDMVTVQDKWHIGSCTKSMTATLSAMLVEDGKVSWVEKLSELFPLYATSMHKGWKVVTLEQLLAHRGGAPHGLDEQGLWGRLWQRVGEPPLMQRSYLTSELLTKQDPAQPTGTYTYANSGYALVGHALETRLNQPWETLITNHLFLPLGMASCGFGMPASIGKTDQPWGHSRTRGWLGGYSLRPIAPGVTADNPSATGPAGSVHLSVADLATYAAFHLQGHRVGHRLLSSEGFQKLHTRFAANGDYALGWSVIARSWGDGDVLTHSGSNTHNYAVVWLAPFRNFAVVICTNVGGAGVDTAVDKVAVALITKFKPSL
jgi:CubicO group peptidase (beta-lactamase class C family)